MDFHFELVSFQKRYLHKLKQILLSTCHNSNTELNSHCTSVSHFFMRASFNERAMFVEARNNKMDPTAMVAYSSLAYLLLGVEGAMFQKVLPTVFFLANISKN
jgi:hypothetical protein